VQKLYITAFFILFFSFNSWAGVASNPFLRPGSNRTPPKIVPPPPPPKPTINPSVAQEVEFRGYFLLKGIPHFCIFNKKANFGEWIKLTEKTYEEFEAQAFDLETETLTLAYSGQNFELRLQEKQSISPTSQPSRSLPKITLPPSNSTSSTGKKVMPPKPTRIPSMPEWLVNRMSSRSSSSVSSRSLNSSSSSSFSNSGSSRFAPIAKNSPSFGKAVQDFSSDPIGSDNQSSLPATKTTSSTSNINSSSNNPAANSLEDAPSSSFGDQFNNPVENTSGDTEKSELDDLPPPPPPPNIFPPSPPPDIVPNFDE
jgi:hypothetical protein